MAMLIRGCPIIGQLSSSHMTAEIASTVQDIHRCLDGGIRRTIVTARDMTSAESALILCHRAESIPRGDDAWERQRDI